MIEAVTIGPIPSWTREPWLPAIIALYNPKRSWEEGASPKSWTFVKTKYIKRTPIVQVSFRLKCTCPSGLEIAGSLCKRGSILSSIGCSLIIRRAQTKRRVGDHCRMQLIGREILLSRLLIQFFLVLVSKSFWLL